MKYMVVENFVPGRKDEINARFRAKGRMMPEGLDFVESWLEREGDRCFQLMETENRELFDQWIGNWKDLASFEVIPLESAEELAARRAGG
jgi:hypothetical protein